MRGVWNELPIHTNPGDELKASEICCLFQSIREAGRVGTTGHHGAQQTTIRGAPAKAWIPERVRWLRKG
jgi:hypothetical protein